MTIKEVEQATGMTRANIRFYEAEGFISPERSDNGYRSYSAEDIKVLERIKLLRSLHISLENVKQMHGGEKELGDVLIEHLNQLEENKKGIEQSQRICRTMKDDGVRYVSLDVQKYSKLYESTNDVTNAEIENDVLPAQKIPLRRFFARMLDYYFYGSLWSVFLILVARINVSQIGVLGDLLKVFVTVIMIRFIEPLLLCLFGTTLGKWILGIRILDEDGNKLTYKVASERTSEMLWKGVGCHIPFFDLIRMRKSYKEYQYRNLDWECDSCIITKDDEMWRIFAYFGTCIAIFAGVFIAMLVPRMPKYRGDITVSQFQENYEHFNKYYGISADEWWNEKPENPYVVVVDVEEDMMKPKVTFVEEDGIMKGLSMELEIEDVRGAYISTYQDEIVLSMLSFICAQEEHHIFNQTWDEILKFSELMPYEEYAFEKYGVKVTRTVECQGYSYIEGTQMMFSGEADNGIKYYRFKFEITK